MLSKEILRHIVVKQKKHKKIENLIERNMLNELIKYINEKRILIISGLRRSGKSTLLFELMQYLDSKNKSYGYVNFEDEKFLDFNAQDFEQLNEVLIETYGDINIYFFDEIQNINKFESFVRRLHDGGKKIIITGSNSSLLSREFGTNLTGRYKLFELYPFSFNEFLKFHAIKHDKESIYLIKEKVNLIKSFKSYFEKGGIPEYLQNNDIDYIKSIYENIIYKDVISRYNLKNQKTFRELINILTTNLASQFSYNSLKNALKLSNAITVKEYLSYLENTYLFFELQRFDFSVKKQLNFPKKIYLVDQIFNKIVGFNFSENKSKILENLVFIELKRKNKEIYYFQENQECDFLIKENTKIVQVIQVCYELNDKNKDREIKGLVEALNKFKLKSGTILTFEQEKDIQLNNKKIFVKPVWKWLLDSK